MIVRRGGLRVGRRILISRDHMLGFVVTVFCRRANEVLYPVLFRYARAANLVFFHKYFKSNFAMEKMRGIEYGSDEGSWSLV